MFIKHFKHVELYSPLSYSAVNSEKMSVKSLMLHSYKTGESQRNIRPIKRYINTKDYTIRLRVLLVQYPIADWSISDVS